MTNKKKANNKTREAEQPAVVAVTTRQEEPITESIEGTTAEAYGAALYGVGITKVMKFSAKEEEIRRAMGEAKAA